MIEENYSMANLWFNSETKSTITHHVDKDPKHLHQTTISDKNEKIDHSHYDSLTLLDVESTTSRFTSINEVTRQENSSPNSTSIIEDTPLAIVTFSNEGDMSTSDFC